MSRDRLFVFSSLLALGAVSSCASPGESLPILSAGELDSPESFLRTTALTTQERDGTPPAGLDGTAPVVVTPIDSPPDVTNLEGEWHSEPNTPPLHLEGDVFEVVTTEGDTAPSHRLAPAGWDDANNEVAAYLGVSWWDKLPDQQPRQAFPTSAGFGQQEELGFAAGLSFRRRIVDGKKVNAWLGADFGLLNHEEDDSYNIILPNGERVDDDVTTSMIYLTAGGRVDVPLGPVELFAGGGGGLYNVSFVEDDDYWSTDEIVSDSELGGYVELGLDIRVGENSSIRIEDRMHLVEFDGMNRFTPGRDELSGPIHNFLIGFVTRF